MKLVILNGPACSGKSSVVERVLKEKEAYFHLSYDSLKWQFSKYLSSTHYDDILTLRLGMLRALCDLKYNVITEAMSCVSRQKHIEIAGSFGYDIVEINLEAEYSVLLERLDERIARGERKENLSRERFDNHYTFFESEKNPDAITFKTDTMDVDTVAAEVLKRI